jgi:omega-6 fatty acid desaturase (delta-12 desaturase)
MPSPIFFRLTRAEHVPQFVEDEGSVVFFKNAYGIAAVRPVFDDSTASDSGIEVDK